MATVAQAQTAWLFGEQHDQPDHQRQAAAAVQELAADGRLHAVVLEMAARGRDTRGLPRDASETQVREALHWSESWPWTRYRQVVMNAVRAGVPVLGGNLPRERVRQVMAEPEWDRQVPEGARQRLLDAVREGHCGLLPPSQLAPMARVQIARDRSLAETLAGAARDAPGDGVLLMLSGAVHASHTMGVPLHLSQVAPGLLTRSIGFRATASPAADGFDESRPAAVEPAPDHCAELAKRGMPSPGATEPRPQAPR
ncbi:ChaN family lipoprotein [Methylibium rhizosphaerae]|uniref:ChaN family lipoprotein n=1 Tax=Methylibium rhizosphaerae TaxID=2570323 RepID=UPI001FE730CE|nr:ChaN family lipoprotein [Methylibium rhizosphaerae]